MLFYYMEQLAQKDQFNELIPLLRNKYRVFTFNFSGHGGNEIPRETFSIKMFAGELSSFIKKNNLAPANIFGYSMGGYAALFASERKPELFGKIFTLAVKFDRTLEIADKEIKMLDTETISAKVPEFAKELVKQHGTDKWELVLAKTSELMISLGNDNLLKNGMLSNIQNEVLVSVGDRDKMVSLEETIFAYRTLHNSKLLIFPNTYHALGKVNIDRLIYEMESFYGI
ncbi:MAG: alpha/beta hydrolase [Ignavibacteria bacterium]|nr:alpha/beta hydrolase [Ignavibacteria bacterium]